MSEKNIWETISVLRETVESIKLVIFVNDTRHLHFGGLESRPPKWL